MTNVSFEWVTTADYRLFTFEKSDKTLAKARINKDENFELPAGVYELFWRARGGDNAPIELKVEAGGASLLLKPIKRKLSPKGIGSGLTEFTVP